MIPDTRKKGQLRWIDIWINGNRHCWKDSTRRICFWHWIVKIELGYHKDWQTYGLTGVTHRAACDIGRRLTGIALKSRRPEFAKFRVFSQCSLGKEQILRDSEVEGCWMSRVEMDVESEEVYEARVRSGPIHPQPDFTFDDHHLL